ncbi:hypothetical protein HSX10_03550 [Winogradskyella undariae]|uniref:hypothetical protein n=1 Tax=Winogradskyella undariae TaxID=1285465 RepID=UPI00156AB37D|nr:hypothetical protein [Winogradskyella undariae]NRR90634.1 hypothetical protein [Winogradskyella undariae]
MPSKSKTTPSPKPTLLALTEVSDYKNSLVVKHFANMNMQSALNSTSKGIGLSSRDKAIGEETIIRCIKNMFIGTSMYFDKVLGDRQAEVIAEELLAKDEYRNLKLEDIVAICIEIKEGETYKLTPATILRHIKKYTKQREALAIQNSLQQSQNQKHAGIGQNIDERALKTIRQIERTNQEVVRTRVATKKFYK